MQWFITFPRSNVDKVEFRDSLLSLDLGFYKVVQESHEDGSPHLHAVIKLKVPQSKSTLLKRFKDIYPNDNKRIDVQSVRSIKHALGYLSKEDKNPLESGEFTDTRNPQQAFLKSFARQLGYSDISTLVQSHREQQEELSIIKQKVHDAYAWYSNYSDFSFPYEIKIIFENLFSDFPILKDDMTLLLNHLNIKHNLSTTGER